MGNIVIIAINDFIMDSRSFTSRLAGARWAQRFAVLGSACLGLLFVSCEDSHAINIAWGTGQFDSFVDSDGILLDGSYTAYLGRFSSIAPSAANLSSWVSDFLVFDSTPVNLSGLGSDSFSSSANLQLDQTSDSPTATPAATFPVDTQAYVWLRNQDTVDPNMEWALYTDSSWGFSLGTASHDPGNEVQWFLSGTPNTDVFGMTNHDGIDSNYDLPGAPEVRTDPKVSFDIQTGTIIPEPSSTLLALVGLMGMVLMRGRR